MQPDDGRVVANLLGQALTGAPITIHGDGSQTRSFCYVSDMVDGLIRLMEADCNPMEPVNLGNPTELTVNELLEMVVALTGTAPKVDYFPLPIDDPRRRKPDISRATALFGWAPRVSIREGLAMTCRWFSEEVGAAALTARVAA